MRALFVAICVLSAAPASAAPDDPTYLCNAAPVNSKLSVSFKPETALSDLAIWVAGFSCKNIVIAPDVAKHATKLTIIAPKQMTPKQAMQLFVDAVESTGLIVQQKPDTIVIKLGPGMPKNCPGTAPASPGGELGGNPLQKKPPPSTPDRSDEDVRKALAAGIKKLDETHYEVTRATLDLITENPMAVVKAARVVPAMTNGKSDGIKLYAIRPSSIYAAVGFTNGDTLIAINGESTTTVDKVIEIYGKLKTSRVLTLNLERRGAPMTLTMVVK